jgi:hypothetical protein
MACIMRMLALFLLLAACDSPRDETVGGVTQSEASALNDAAAMLDANAIEPVAK